MESLTKEQLDHLRTCLYRSGATPAQARTLLPLMAREVEHYMWIGLPFEAALAKVELEADNSPVHYFREKHRDMLVMENDATTSQPDLNDIVFANRNRAYGAYDLRKAYDSALVNALITTTGLLLVVLAAMDAFQRGRWTYLSWGGLAWVVGIHLIGLAGFRFYFERVRFRRKS